VSARGAASDDAVPRRRRRAEPVRAIVLRRSDFRESSRIVTMLTREHGRLVGLAKGAHRPDSPFLGRLDFLNEVAATFSADRGGLRLLERVELLRERRPLREPTRFLAASHLARLCDLAMPDGEVEPRVFDLLLGGLNLLERCPSSAVARVVLGLELRLLERLGGLPDLQHCAACGAELATAFVQGEGHGLVCHLHAGLPRQPVADDVLGLLRGLLATPARRWPTLGDAPTTARAAPLPARWLAAATEHRSPLRALLFGRA